jgi:hypothetical protein
MDIPKKGHRLGHYAPTFFYFPDTQKTVEMLKKECAGLSTKDRLVKIHTLLLDWIQKTKTPCFLLPAISQFIENIQQQDLVSGYTFSQFEFWLIHFSSLTTEEKHFVRSKIVGRYIPREGYQSLFPIGMGKTYPGSHYVTAHSSPDLDTTVASFWGWIDAFAAQVGSGLHIWNVPGGAPKSQVEIDFLFYQVFGKDFFHHFAKTRTALALSAFDLALQKGVVHKKITDSVELEEEIEKFSVIVDEQGCYVGNWSKEDREETRKVTVLIQHLMRWFVGTLQAKLIKELSRERVLGQELQKALDQIFAIEFADAMPIKEFADKQKKRLDVYLAKVLHLPNGIKTSYREFWNKMKDLSVDGFASFLDFLHSLPSSKLFNSEGMLIEDRSVIFQYVGDIATGLEKTIQGLRQYMEQMNVAFAIKKEVLSHASLSINQRAEVEEIREKMQDLSCLTVTMSHGEEKEYPVGMVHAADLMKPILGTVSLRDFCNRDETKIPSYFEVISVVDHHKSVLQTSAAPMALIADAQSANALVAELAFSLNDRYIGALSSEKTVKELCAKTALTRSESRILQRALHKSCLYNEQAHYFVDASREYLEYLHYLYAILDDTDLLSKVSVRDVLAVASLLNRLKTIAVGEEIEIISFDDLPQDAQFAKKAAQRILQNEDMYSLYKKIYSLKEESVEESLHKCVHKEASTLFADTKVQNGCSRVGQSKLFAKNFPTYTQYCSEICHSWYLEAKTYYEESGDCDLHMHMISTIPSADDVYAGEIKEYSHKDELWIWIPQTEQAIGHLKNFLGAFSHSSQIASSHMEVEFFAGSETLMGSIFHESFKDFDKVITDKKISAPVAVIRYRAGLLNSRKAMVSPYLPKLVK